MYYYSTGVQEIMVLHDCIEQSAPASIILLRFDDGKYHLQPRTQKILRLFSCPAQQLTGSYPSRLQHIET